ncbi:MAG TPA: PAS domain-containing protein [Thermoanaerobaculia bacterium]|jgi:PAS domain S-box-containing protein
MDTELPPSDVVANVFDAVGTGLLIWRLDDAHDDRSLTLASANAAASAHLGFDAQALEGRRIDDAMPKLRAVGVPETLANVVRTGEPQGLGPIASYYGRAFRVSRDAVAIAFANLPMRLFEEAERVERRYRAILRAVPDQIFRIAADGTYRGFEGQEDALPLRKETFIGTTLQETLPQDAAARALAAIRTALAQGSTERFEYALDAAGERRHYESRIAPCGPDEVVAVSRDITDAHRGRAALEQRVEERTRQLVAHIAERQLAEAKLRDSYERVQVVLDASPIPIVELDQDGIVRGWNVAAERLFEWRAEEVLGRVSPIISADRIDEFRGILSALRRGATFSGVEGERVSRSGRRISVSISGAPVRTHGEVTGILLLYNEVKSAERASRELDELARKLRALREFGATVTNSLDEESVLDALHRELAINIGIAAGAIYTTTDDTPRLRRAWGEVRDERRIAAGPLHLVIDRDADADFVRTIAHEAAVALANAALYETARRAEERARQLSRTLLRVQEEEHRLLGRELHDQFGQLLTGLRLTLQRVRPATDGDPHLAEAENLAAEMLQRVRALSLELRPPMLDDAGLVASLAWHAERFTTQSGIEVDLRHSDVPRLEGGVEIAAFRIVQEALTNVARHAAAQRVAIRLWRAGERLFIDVEDDGRGFDPAAVGDTLGLSGMHERAGLLGGELRIASSSEGTTVSLELPLGTEQQ